MSGLYDNPIKDALAEDPAVVASGVDLDTLDGLWNELLKEPADPAHSGVIWEGFLRREDPRGFYSGGSGNLSGRRQPNNTTAAGDLEAFGALGKLSALEQGYLRPGNVMLTFAFRQRPEQLFSRTPTAKASAQSRFNVLLGRQSAYPSLGFGPWTPLNIARTEAGPFLQEPSTSAGLKPKVLHGSGMELRVTVDGLSNIGSLLAEATDMADGVSGEEETSSATVNAYDVYAAHTDAGCKRVSWEAGPDSVQTIFELGTPEGHPAGALGRAMPRYPTSVLVPPAPSPTPSIPLTAEQGARHTPTVWGTP